MKIQIDIPEELNKQMKIYKVQNDLETLQEAAIELIKKGVQDDKNRS